MIQEMKGQITLFDLIEDSLDGCSGKTYPVPIVPQTGRTSDVSLKNWQELKNQKFAYLCLQGESGLQMVQSKDGVGVSLGEPWMLNIGESPKDVEDVTLSAILMPLTEIQLQRYSLSVMACQGILRRAKKRGKTLPEVLKVALMRGAGITDESDIGEGDTDDEPTGEDDE